MFKKVILDIYVDKFMPFLYPRWDHWDMIKRNTLLFGET